MNSKKKFTSFRKLREAITKAISKTRSTIGVAIDHKTDLLKTKYNLLEIQSLIAKAKSNIEVQTEDLKFQMGIDKEEQLEVKEFNVPNHLTDTIDFQKIKKKALESSIQSLIAKSQVEIAKAQETAALGNMLPKINAFASYGVATERTKWKQTREDAEWMGGFLFLGMYFLLEVIMTTIKLQNWKKRIKNCQK